MSAYPELEKRFAQMQALKGAGAMLNWDASTMMPEAASDIRGEQLAALAEVLHERITDPRLGDLLGEAEGEVANLNAWQQANLREMRHLWRHENAIDTSLVSAFTRACNDIEMRWRAARKENDFKGFAPHLAHMVTLVREMAQAKAAALHCSPYDALLDSYDPGMRAAQIDAWFGELAAFLPGFTQAAIDRQSALPPPHELSGPFHLDAQRALGRKFMEALGFDFTHGRLDESLHPFCGGVPGDVRLTTRYNAQNFTESLWGVFHETGHALYEFGLPAKWRGQPVAEARGMSMHESQSLLIEMQLCRGRDFLAFAAPSIGEAFGGTGEAWEAENLFRLCTRVRRSLIRVNADEVTYPSHIILRYRLEKAMVYDELQVADLQGAWADGMRELIGIAPKSDRDGCLQDIHWAGGSFGYFPTYTVGAMIAAQLFDAAKKQVNNLAADIRKGNIAPLTSWLREHVHALGSSLSTQEIVQKATGAPLSPAVYIQHLTQRYLDA